jgi:solute carrier family 35 protein E1
MAGAPDSVALLLFFVFWYAGNMKYNEYNTSALTAVGGKTSGLTMTVATMQLGVCVVYAIITWAVKLNPGRMFGLQAPTRQDVPQVTRADLIRSIPLAFCAAGAHAATVFALGGDPLFGQIGEYYKSHDARVNTRVYSFVPFVLVLLAMVSRLTASFVHIPPTVKAAEPVLAAFVGAVFYAKAPSFNKICCLPIIVGGVAFASLKKGDDGSYSLKFDATALIFGMLANAFAAFKGGENTKLMSDKGVAQRYGGVGNQVSCHLIGYEFASANSFLPRISQLCAEMRLRF